MFLSLLIQQSMKANLLASHLYIHENDLIPSLKCLILKFSYSSYLNSTDCFQVRGPDFNFLSLSSLLTII